MIGTLYKRNSCATLHPPVVEHLSRMMSKQNGGTPSTSVKRCHSNSKVEKSKSGPINLKERINSELQVVAQNLCLIESMIPCMRSADDSKELISQLRETNQKLQQVLPALHVFMTLPSPPSKEEKERFQHERRQLSREFEAAILSYKNAHKALNLEMKRLKGDGSK